MLNDDNESSHCELKAVVTTTDAEESIQVILEKFQEMVRNGQRVFIKRTVRGTDYITQLTDLGLTNIDEAWNVILQLKKHHYVKGPVQDYGFPNEGEVIWVFKCEVNEIMTYIKLKDEHMGRGCVCISFHEDYP